MNTNIDSTLTNDDYNRRLMGNIQRLPLVVASAQGATLKLQDGRELLDFWGDEGVCSLGYNTVEYRAAVAKFPPAAPHQLPDIYPNQLRFKAAEVIALRTEMDRVFFSGSGAESNEAAIKLARKYWWDKDTGVKRDTKAWERRHAPVHARHRILTVEGNFHGRTAFAMAAGDFRCSPYHRWGFGPIPEGFGVIKPVYDATTGECKFMEVVADGVEHDEPREVDWSTVAAVILAPVLGNNVVQTYPPAFWAGLARIRAMTGTLLIYDDVQAGNGRAGHFATYQHPECGVKPDIMTLAKGIAMGYPMAVTLASEDVAASFTPGVHFNTFAGSPFVCHMAIQMYAWLDRNLPLVRAIGDRIRAEFKKREEWLTYSGWGMLNGFTPLYDKFKYDGYKFCTEAREHGLSLVTHRPLGIIRFTPPFTIAPHELDAAFKALDATHEKCQRQ